MRPAPEVKLDHAETDLEAEQLLARAATSVERAYSAGRAVFSGLLVLRHALTCPVADAWFVSPILLLLTGFSACVLLRPKDRVLSRSWLRFSVLLDAAVCAAVLSTVAVWPPADYAGLPGTPEFAAILLLILATSLRLYVDVVLLGVAANLLLSLGLLGFDLAYNGAMWQDGMRRVSIVFVYFVGGSILAYLFVARTRSLVRAAARAAYHALQSKKSIESVLRAQHDARSLVSALTLRIDRLMRDSPRGAPFLADHLTQLNDCVQELANHVSLAMNLARADSSSPEALVSVPLRPALDLAIRSVLRDYEGVTIEVSVRPEAAVVLMKGGADALQQLFTRLLTNAAQGDGGARASRIEVRVVAARGRVNVSILDDGPGFPETVIENQAARPVLSRKPHSSGLGLWLVGHATRTSGGTIALSNEAAGGASIVIELATPAAPESVRDPRGQKFLPLSDRSPLD
ncbi:MAG TPA: HAMP domain-containing sensor histidine kinase [Polyangiaceae bacterium]